ncbi:hypothetical protein V0288_15260 [Pannus brasiliensis CCIBt3594]|uniref:Uncharacterized protein n=1 Tax=Pannus brasiliensis CCIBt3594 TaxID=1427578 RepID=A0AAW9QZ49_9CHRO
MLETIFIVAIGMSDRVRARFPANSRTVKAISSDNPINFSRRSGYTKSTIGPIGATIAKP